MLVLTMATGVTSVVGSYTEVEPKKLEQSAESET